eukprot:CAMPEP_0170564614 /NCGR_PEP_ID=MMETSP0211-20121228/73904_1 /TAXON_ID=311385 /ORGANISM="Pseudokeronopsis sp., Strain OXSARD2" /LENGTH=33 /DNA_ID= /DNA_START= /DNA_END= /DNA_ORIENTATION=
MRLRKVKLLKKFDSKILSISLGKRHGMILDSKH